MVSLALCALLATVPSDPPSLPEEGEARRALVRRSTQQELAEILRLIPPERLLSIGQAAVRELGTYSVILRKQERVRGKVLEPQVLSIFVREQPFALRMQVIGGPKKGRKVFYDESLRKTEFRVREAGLLGIKALWLSVDSRLARRDTNHRITDLGFGPILRQLGRDIRVAARHGGFTRADQGFDEQGRWCVSFVAPPSAASELYARRTRLCLNPALGLPVKIEVYDAQGFLERAEFTKIKKETALPPGFFTPKAAGL